MRRIIPLLGVVVLALVVTSGTTLTEDHQGVVEVRADGVTLDCAGHVVTGLSDF